MYSNISLEVVLPSLQITTQDHLQKLPLGTCTTTCLLGLSAFFLTARILCITLQEWEKRFDKLEISFFLFLFSTILCVKIDFWPSILQIKFIKFNIITCYFCSITSCLLFRWFPHWIFYIELIQGKSTNDFFFLFCWQYEVT